MEDLFGVGKLSEQGMETLKMVYPDLLQPSVKKVGVALENVIGLLETISLPIKLANVKASALFNNHMKKYQEKLESYNESEIVSISPDIALPIMDRLTYLENEEIGEMFINLLVNASHVERSSKSHPSYFNTLNNISVDEARILKYLHDNEFPSIPFVNYNADFDYTEHTMLNLIRNVTFLNNQVEFISPERIFFYIANLIKLGILEETRVYSDPEEDEDITTYEKLDYMYSKGAHEVAESRSNSLELGEYELECIRGSYQITEYGHFFIEICNSIKDQEESL